MKRLIGIILSCMLLGSLTSCAAAGETAVAVGDYGGIFADNEVIDINIDIDEAELQDMFDNAIAEEYHEASITVDGITVADVGIRTKGNSSLSSVVNSESDRYGFKIKLDEYVDDQTINGLDLFVLNGQYADPSYMREYLTYTTAAEIGLTTPDLVYANIYFNGEYFGFYICIESYEDAFVSRVSDDDNAVLYKADSENCTLKNNDDTSGFEVKVGEDEENKNIKNLIEVLNGTTEENKEELEAILDVDSVLKNIALNTVIGNYDSYSGSKAHNYYLLYSDGKFEYLGWDYNMSIGGFADDNGSSVNTDVYEPLLNASIEDRPLIGVLLSIDEYNQRYLGYVEELTDYLSDFESQVEAVSGLISSYVENDPTAFTDYDEYLTNISASDTDLTSLSLADNSKSGMFGGDHAAMADMQANGEVPEDFAERPDRAEAPAAMEGSEPDLETGATSEANNDTVPADRGFDTVPVNGGMQRGLMTTSVSIIDYITQRLEVIAEQLQQ